jgi:hypothetical protein
MKKRIDIDHLTQGMFVTASVDTVVVRGEMHHYLVPLGAGYHRTDVRRRVRLPERHRRQIGQAGGILVNSRKRLAALVDIALSSVTINTDKGDDLPGHLEPLPLSPDSPGDAAVDSPTLDGEQSAEASESLPRSPRNWTRRRQQRLAPYPWSH